MLHSHPTATPAACTHPLGESSPTCVGSSRLEVTDKPGSHQKIGFDLFEYGIIKRRVIAGETDESPNWRIGHPNILRVGTGFQFRVPVDNYNTLDVYYSAHLVAPDQMVKQETIPFYEVPVPTDDEHGRRTAQATKYSPVLRGLVEKERGGRALKQLVF